MYLHLHAFPETYGKYGLVSLRLIYVVLNPSLPPRVRIGPKDSHSTLTVFQIPIPRGVIGGLWLQGFPWVLDNLPS